MEALGIWFAYVPPKGATTLKVTRVRVLFQLLLNEPKIQKAGAFNRAKKETKAPGRAITGAEPKVTRHNH